MASAATGLFGSGWAWLVVEGDALKIVRTRNAEVPFTKGQIPLLTIDV
ncbi:MAG TPA: Fe-Mn family superoxide dismutase, partial [Casimicrobiaceae bacterium]|nr:Fe-Mn family superoxide dismutase [Casimicrobiaceae bacterium]